MRIEPGEKRAVFTAFALMFCVMGGYFAVRPIRETVGTILGEAVTSDTLDLDRGVRDRNRAVVRLAGGARAPRGAGAGHLRLRGRGVRRHRPGVPAPIRRTWSLARVFYVGISVMNLFLVSVFWSFLLEIFQSEQTKRLFGFIAAGGTTGALVGPVR